MLAAELFAGSESTPPKQDLAFWGEAI